MGRVEAPQGRLGGAVRRSIAWQSTVGVVGGRAGQLWGRLAVEAVGQALSLSSTAPTHLSCPPTLTYPQAWSTAPPPSQWRTFCSCQRWT